MMDSKPTKGQIRRVPYFGEIKPKKLTNETITGIINEDGELEAYIPDDEQIQYREEIWNGQKWERK